MPFTVANSRPIPETPKTQLSRHAIGSMIALGVSIFLNLFFIVSMVASRQYMTLYDQQLLRTYFLTMGVLSGAQVVALCLHLPQIKNLVYLAMGCNCIAIALILLKLISGDWPMIPSMAASLYSFHCMQLEIRKK